MQIKYIATEPPDIQYETDITLTMSCPNVTATNEDVLEQGIVTVLEDLISTQYPDSEIYSITVNKTDDGQCKYIITTKV